MDQAWTETTDLNTGRYILGVLDQEHHTAIVLVVQMITSGQQCTESWNGSSWTEVNDLNTARGSFWWCRN